MVETFLELAERVGIMDISKYSWTLSPANRNRVCFICVISIQINKIIHFTDKLLHAFDILLGVDDYCPHL